MGFVMNRLYSKFVKILPSVCKSNRYVKENIRQLVIKSGRRQLYGESAIVFSESNKSIKLPPKIEVIKKQNFDYFLVLDFEATCDNPVNVLPQEIIEFPVLKISGQSFQTESIFHSYVRPKVNSQITTFCTQLTGITQDVVDDQPYFEDVYMDFKQWMQVVGLFKPNVKFTFVTCGDWDLRYLLQVQCKGLRLPVPSYFMKWINIKTCFSEFAQTWPRNMVTMLKMCELDHEGKLHSGIDDCKNIAKILKSLAERGVVFEQNSRNF